ncbi:MAG: TRAP transporter small permease [Candidatus Methylomirabilales bacterium]
MKVLEKLAGAADRLLTVWIVSALVVMVLTIVSDVFLRESISYPLIWNLEVAQYCLTNLTYVGAALAFRRRAHISINSLTSLLPARAQQWVDVAGRAVLLPFLGVLVYSGVQILQKAKGVTPTLRLPMWIYYFPIFIGSVLIAFYAVVQILEAVAALRSSGGTPQAGAATPPGAI